MEYDFNGMEEIYTIEQLKDRVNFAIRSGVPTNWKRQWLNNVTIQHDSVTRVINIYYYGNFIYDISFESLILQL